MKKYKLIKWYPSLPKDWKEGMEIGYGDKEKISCYSPCSRDFSDMPFYRFPPDEVENNPEFWEEVVEKDYEILSFKGSLHEDMLDIYSIKRLSDGEIFNIGDKIIVNNYNEVGEKAYFAIVNTFIINPKNKSELYIIFKEPLGYSIGICNLKDAELGYNKPTTKSIEEENKNLLMKIKDTLENIEKLIKNHK